MTYRGPFMSEVIYVSGDTHRVPEDCVAAAGIDMANCATGGEIPVTAAEREALRVDCGDTQGGMDLAHLKTGLDKRYGLTPLYLGTLEAIRSHLEDGWSLVILGWLDAVPVTYWNQHSGDVYHAMEFNQGDKPGFAHLANPLAPANHRGYEVPMSVVLDFARSSNGRGGIPRGIYCLGLREQGPQGGPITSEEPMSTFKPAPGRIAVKKGTFIYDGPDLARRISLVQQDGELTVLGGIAGWRVAVVNPVTAAWLAAGDVTDLPLPTAPTFSQHDIDNAKASGYENARTKAIAAVEAL